MLSWCPLAASLFGRELSVLTSRFFIKFYETKDEDEIFQMLSMTEVREGESELDDVDDDEQLEQHPMQELSIPLRLVAEVSNTPRRSTQLRDKSRALAQSEIGNEPESVIQPLQERVAEVSITPRRSTRLRDKPLALASAQVRKVFKTRKRNVKKGKTSDAQGVAPQSMGETILSVAQVYI
jgi:hypothetical protein